MFKINCLKLLYEDFMNNSSTKGIIIIFFYRSLNCFYKSKLFLILLFPIFFLLFVLNKIFVELLIGCEISFKTSIGKNITIHHGQSIVVNKDTIIGDNCIIRHCTTIGNKLDRFKNDLGSPNIGDNVDIGSNSVLIGPIRIGNNVIIGAGSIVVKDVPQNSVIAGNPAKIIKELI